MIPFSMARLLAHQGGWDEILMVLVPVGVFAALLYVANQRAARLAARDGEIEMDESAGPTGPDGPSDATPPRNERSGPI